MTTQTRDINSILSNENRRLVNEKLNADDVITEEKRIGTKY